MKYYIKRYTKGYLKNICILSVITMHDISNNSVFKIISKTFITLRSSSYTDGIYELLKHSIKMGIKY